MIKPQEFFALLSDETRLRCLLLLYKEKELCVCEFCDILGSVQPKISRHLMLLRTSGLVSDRREGQWVHYRLSETLPVWMKQILATALEDLRNCEPYRSDFEKVVETAKKNPCKLA